MPESVSSAMLCEKGADLLSHTAPPSQGSMTPPLPNASETSRAFALGTASEVVRYQRLA